jgi:glucose-6-phosphate isomerase
MTYRPTATAAWKTLQQQAELASAERITDFFTQNPKRSNEMSVECGELHLDFSKNLVSDQTWKALLDLVDQ